MKRLKETFLVASLLNPNLNVAEYKIIEALDEIDDKLQVEKNPEEIQKLLFQKEELNKKRAEIYNMKTVDSTLY